MRVYLRGTKWWADLRRYGQGRVPLDTEDAAEAKRRAETLARAAWAGRLTKPAEVAGPTLQEAYDSAWKTHLRWRHARAPQEIERAWRRVRDHFGAGKPLAAIDRNALAAMSGELVGRGLGATQVNGAVSIVGVLRDVHGLPKLTVARQPRKRRQRTYSDTEVAAFLAWHRDRGDREMTAFLTVLAGTGFRFSEAHELERRDVAPGRLTVRSEVAKSGKARTIPTPPAVAEAIADRLQAVGGGLRDRVWSLSKTEIHDRWTAMRAALGLAGDPEAVLHTFRHTVATKLVAAYGIGVAQVWLGHASITTTAGYSHVDVRHLEAAVCAVSVPAPSASLTAALRPPVPALCHLEGAEVVSKAETDEGLAVQPAGARDVPEQKLHLVGQDEKQNVT